MSTACVRLKCPGVAKSVLMQLADIANDHGHAWPSIDTLCMRTDWSRRAVIDALAWLEEAGAIARNRENGRHTSYTLTPTRFTGPRHSQQVQQDQPVDNPPDQCATRTGAPAARVRQPHPTSAAGAPDQCAKRTLITKNHQEPLIPPYPPSGGAPVDNLKPEPTPETAPADGPGFAAFFAGYPRQVDEAQALRAWKRLSPNAELQGEIAQAIAAWIRSPEWQREGGRFIPKPGNWLTHERWRDVPGIAAPPPPPAAPPPPRAAPLTREQLAANHDRARAVAAQAKAVLLGGSPVKRAAATAI